jgi:hypothetical protein
VAACPEAHGPPGLVRADLIPTFIEDQPPPPLPQRPVRVRVTRPRPRYAPISGRGSVCPRRAAFCPALNSVSGARAARFGEFNPQSRPDASRGFVPLWAGPRCPDAEGCGRCGRSQTRPIAICAGDSGIPARTPATPNFFPAGICRSDGGGFGFRRRPCCAPPRCEGPRVSAIRRPRPVGYAG